jgi:hypothetical protein
VRRYLQMTIPRRQLQAVTTARTFDIVPDKLLCRQRSRTDDEHCHGGKERSTLHDCTSYPLLSAPVYPRLQRAKRDAPQHCIAQALFMKKADHEPLIVDKTELARLFRVSVPTVDSHDRPAN